VTKTAVGTPDPDECRCNRCPVCGGRKPQPPVILPYPYPVYPSYPTVWPWPNWTITYGDNTGGITNVTTWSVS